MLFSIQWKLHKNGDFLTFEEMLMKQKIEWLRKNSVLLAVRKVWIYLRGKIIILIHYYLKIGESLYNCLFDICITLVFLYVLFAYCNMFRW